MVAFWLLAACGDPVKQGDSASPVDLDADGHMNDVDCDDADAAVYPGAPETCRDVGDLDCDGVSSFVDADGDGTAECDDCDDADAASFPGGTEACGGADEDCDGATDEEGAVGEITWSADLDGDGFGDAAVQEIACAVPEGFVADASDCDDSSPDAHPGAEEGLDDGVDSDCDGGERCAVDADGDGYAGGGVASSDLDCLDVGESAGNPPDGDCDDAAPAVSPGAVEVCNGVDDDCDGTADIGVGDPWYADADGDGYGDPTSVMLACDLPPGYVSDATDCEDDSATAHPGGTEVCGDGYDGDCDADAAECRLSGDLLTSDADVWLGGSATGDQLGAAMAIGDFDGDGGADLLAGMYAHGVTFEGGEGAAVVLYGPMTTSGEALAVADASWYGDRSAAIGCAVAAGDLDGDDLDDLVVAASPGTAGVAYVMYGGVRRSGDSLLASSSADVTIPGVTYGDDVGDAVSASGDIDGDGFDELAIGASGINGGFGAAYLYYGSSGRLSGTVATASADAEILATESGYFGDQLTLVEDMDGDGLDEVLVGAPHERSTGSSAGAAYLFLAASVPAGSMSTTDADLSLDGATSGDYFGVGVYSLLDITGDGYGDAGVCASGYDAQAGALWLYSGAASVSGSPTASAIGQANGDGLGCDSGSAGDLDADGISDLLIGASGVDLGVVYLWHGPIPTGTLDPATAEVRLVGAGTSSDLGRLAPEAADLTGDGHVDVLAAGPRDWVYENYAGGIFVWAGIGGI